jgi:hypothetical protein
VTIFLLSERCERTIVTVTFNVDCDVFRNAETQLLTFDSIFHSRSFCTVSCRLLPQLFIFGNGNVFSRNKD